jgi:hypothetical protein
LFSSLPNASGTRTNIVPKLRSQSFALVPKDQKTSKVLLKRMQGEVAAASALLVPAMQQNIPSIERSEVLLQGMPVSAKAGSQMPDLQE